MHTNQNSILNLFSSIPIGSYTSKNYHSLDRSKMAIHFTFMILLIAFPPPMASAFCHVTEIENREYIITCTEIQGNENNDLINAPGFTESSETNTTAMGISLTISGLLVVENDPVSASSAVSSASAMGIDGAGGNDRILNQGHGIAEAISTVTGTGVVVDITLSSEGNATGSALSDAGVTAVAAATGIDGGEGDDLIDNQGGITLSAEADATAVSVALSVSGSLKGSAEGKALSDSSALAQTTAVGIAGGAGADEINSTGAIFAQTVSTATAVGVGVDITLSSEGNATGSALSDAKVTAVAATTGIDGGEGDDLIDNQGGITLSAEADATAVSVALSVSGSLKGSAEGKALSDSSALAQTTAVGIAGGAGADEINSTGAIFAQTVSTATAVGVGVDITLSSEGNATGSALSDAKVTAVAATTGIDGGEGDDLIDNQGGITLSAEADATAVSVALSVSGSLKGSAEGKALSDSSALAQTTAVGIAGGAGADEINSTGAIFAQSVSTATAVGVGVDITLSSEGNATGSALSDAKVTAIAAATGIDGGDGDDLIDNQGVITLLAGADATGVAVSLGISGSATFEGNATGDSSSQAVSNSSVISRASAFGMDGGEGNDVISNVGGFHQLQATSEAVGVSASLNVTVTGSFKGDLEGNATGQALSDASVTALAEAAAIRGNAGDDTIENKGDIGSLAAQSEAIGVAASLGISGNVAFKGGAEGDVEGQALSDSKTTAYAEAIGLDGGQGNDVISNEGRFHLLKATSEAIGVSASLNVAAGVAIEGDAKVDVSGAALSDAEILARSKVTAARGGDGDDRVTNTANLDLIQAQSAATGVAASLSVAGTVAFKGKAEGEITGSALSDSSVTAEATAIGLDGGDGSDTIVNKGAIGSLSATSHATGVAAALGASLGLSIKDDAQVEVSGGMVSDAAVMANAVAVGIRAGAGNDSINNTGDMVQLEADATALGVAAGLSFTSSIAIKGNSTAEVSGEAVADSSVTAQAAVTGIDGGLGDDTIDNNGTINLLSTADATGVAAVLDVAASLNFKGLSMSDVSGSAASNTSVRALASATGIDGGEGDDTIRNSGFIKLMDQGNTFNADALGVSAALNVSGNIAIKGVAVGTVEGVAASDATVTSNATAIGIDGGRGDDFIHNTGMIELHPSSKGIGVAASLNISGNMVGESEGVSLSDASVSAKSTAVGIEGGHGDDTIINEGSITLHKQNAIDAKALGVAASLNVSGNLHGTADGQALSKASTVAEAIAFGISGDSGSDEITNTGAITAYTGSEALGVAVAADVTIAMNGDVEGAALSDVSTTAKAQATGIDGGEGDDIIGNTGVIELYSTADATGTAVSVGIAGAMRGQATGEALSNAATTAVASAVGISGGAGLDEITNNARIDADVKSYARATSVAAEISVALQGHAEGSALSDSTSTASALAMGIDGGADGDTIVNTGLIDLSSYSDARSTAVSVGLAGSMTGMAEGKSVADSSAKATSESIGIFGGEGNDSISSTGSQITTFAHSLSQAQSVSVTLSGTVGMAEGAAVADSSSSSLSYSAGIDGGAGDDIIMNNSTIEAAAKAKSTASSTTVGVTLGIGAAENVGTGNSSATAKAFTAGIVGGDGDDEITNRADITIGGRDADPMAEAIAGTTAVTVGVSVGSSEGEASSSAMALAEVDATGISSGAGDDALYNYANILVGPGTSGSGSMANATAGSTTVKVDVTIGASLGKSSSDTSATALVNLAGIRSGSGDDLVHNEGTITVGTLRPMATATAGSETVDVGITVGGSVSDASSDSSATAHSSAIGIETGYGADAVINQGELNIFSSAAVLSTAVARQVSLTIGAIDGSVESDASSFSVALATGIDTGEGADEVNATGNFVVKARSSSATASSANDLNILAIGSAVQAASADSSATAEALARGIHGGTGADVIGAAGKYEVSAESFVTSGSRSSTLAGLSVGENKQKAQAQAGTTALALAIGIDGGEGDDTISNAADLNVNATSNATTASVSAANTGFNLAGSSSGQSIANAQTNVTATGIGLRGGPSDLADGESDADLIINSGEISISTKVNADTNSKSTAGGFTFAGAADGLALSDASAKVLALGIGIDGGADDDRIVNRGTIIVDVTADSNVKSTSEVNADVVFGSATSMGVSDASADVRAEAAGILGGSGNDRIVNRAPIMITAQSIGDIIAASTIDADVTFGGASSGAISNASVTKKATVTGIDGGAGHDTILNFDILDVNATSKGTVTSRSNASARSFFGRTSSGTDSAAALEGSVEASGITGGSGNDHIRNSGQINAIADADLTVASISVSTARSTFRSAQARAASQSTAQAKAASLAVSGDNGNDTIVNEEGGEIKSSARAKLEVREAAVAIARSTFGSEYTEAASTNFSSSEAIATGVDGGAGDDTITNNGTIIVGADSETIVRSLTVSSDGPATSDARTLASASAQGIVGGDGDDTILNTGSIDVSAGNHIKSVKFTAGSLVDVDARIESTVIAVGIDGDGQSDDGAGSNTIANSGSILVDSNSTIDASSWSLGFGSTNIESWGLGQALSTGIRGGSSDDSLSNSGEITTRSTADVTSRERVAIVGVADLEFVFEARTHAVGVDGGTGNDDFFNDEDGAMSTTAVSKVDVDGVSTAILGRITNLVRATGDATALGLDLGSGNNTADNFGEVSVSGLAVSRANALSNFTLYGETNADADAVANANTWGIRAGNGENQILNSGLIDATATANATSIARGSVIGTGPDDTSRVTMDSDRGNSFFFDESPPKTNIVGTWIRFTSGENAGFITRITDYDRDTGEITIAGALPGDLKAEVLDKELSTVTQDTGDNKRTIVDAYLIDRSQDEVIGKFVSFTFVGQNGHDRTFESRITAFDSDTGTITIADELPIDLEQEVVDDEGNITTPATEYAILGKDDDGNVIVLVQADRYSFSAAGDGASASVASARAFGIDLGSGRAVVMNSGTIQVMAAANATTTAQGQVTNASADATSIAYGIRTGDGDDEILNSGKIDVSADVSITAAGANRTGKAAATGIDAGNGNNLILNEGDIVVTAQNTLPGGEAPARGIVTGSGDDVIINTGKIFTHSNVSDSAIALDTGSGADQVTLGIGSQIQGLIDLGAGDDILKFIGSPVVLGDVTGGPGTDELLFMGAGSIDFTLLSFEAAIKTGDGAFYVPSLQTMQRLEIEKGTLTIDDNYAMAGESTFQTTLYGIGDCGRLEVNGEAGLDGSLIVLKGAGPYVDGRRYEVLTADQTTGWFSNESMPEPTLLVSFQTHRYDDRVEVESLVESFSSVTHNRVHHAIGLYLDRILPTATGDLWNVLGELQSLSLPELSTAFSSLSPDSYDVFSTDSIRLIRELDQFSLKRLEDLRFSQLATSSETGKPVLLAYAGTKGDLGQIFPSADTSRANGNTGVWFNAFGQWGDQNARDGYAGHEYTMYGVSLGIDRSLSDKLIAGLSAGFSKADVDLKDSLGEGTVETISGRVYGSYFTGSFYADMALSYGSNRYDNERMVNVGAIQRRVESDHRGDILSAVLGAGYLIDLERWLVEPFGSVRYTRLDEDGFTETGGGDVSLSVDGRTTEALSSELGLRIARAWHVPGWIIVPDVNVALLYDFDIDDRVIVASFVGAPETSFSLPGRDVEQLGWGLGAGIRFLHKDRLSISLKYRGEFRDGESSSGVLGEMGYSF
jgi:hypothetical protein